MQEFTGNPGKMSRGGLDIEEKKTKTDSKDRTEVTPRRPRRGGVYLLKQKK